MGEKVIRDPIWGDLVLSAEPEMRLVDTPEFQRLRGIKQLGAASLVYPGAHHTRFEHSLGTTHVAGRILDALERTGHPVDARDRAAVRVAALLHDITHIPFGHTFEDERRIFGRHDTPARTARFLESGELGRRLRASGLEELVKPILKVGDLPPERRWLRDVVSGTVCADLLDYLARDAFHCGIAARWDERVFRTFAVEGGRLAINAEKRGILRQDVLTEVVNLLRLRYTLSERVYFHHGKVAAGAMVSKAVECAVGDGLKLDDLFGLRDEGLLGMLATRFGKNRTLRKTLDRFLARDLHKRCYVLTAAIDPARRRELTELYHQDRARRERDEAALEKTLKLDPGDVIIYCPSEKMQLKEAKIPVRLGDGHCRPLAELGIREMEVLHAKHRELWKLYVFIAGDHRDRAEAASRACAELFGEPSQLEVLKSGQLRLFSSDARPEDSGRSEGSD